MRVTLDLTFLQESWPIRNERPRPVNVYDVLREGWRETRVDMTLQFFLDPNERHGFGALVIDALLRLLDGAPLIGPGGHTSEPFAAEDAMGSDAWEINTQTNYIDVYAVNPDLSLAVVLENKIGHHLNNPLKTYAAFARKQGNSNVLVAVLAPDTREHIDPAEMAFLSASISYAEFAGSIKQAPELLEMLLSPKNLDQQRSLDLLQQFIEARTGDPTMTDLADEARQLQEWKELLKKHAPAISAFEQSRRSVTKVVRERHKRMQAHIAVSLERAGLTPDDEWHGTYRDETWDAYYFADPDWSVELKFSSNPDVPAIFVYDRRGKTYKDSTTKPLDEVSWTDSDETIADLFVQRVIEILDQARLGMRPSPVQPEG